jgi:hypothetical protein
MTRHHGDGIIRNGPWHLVDRLHELESMRRSIAMLQPGTKALSREEAMRLIAELQDVEGRLKRLKNGLQRLVAEDG